MAAMSTSLTGFSNNGNSRTYTVTATHTAAKPRLVIQTRKVPAGNQTVLENRISVIYATTDAAGNVIPDRDSFQVIHRRPINGQAADDTAALAVLRDIVASDEFTAMTTTQNLIKG